MLNRHAANILSSIGDAVVITDTDRVITYLNRVAEHLTGWTTAEAVGRPVDSVIGMVSDETRVPIECMAARCLREGRAIDLQDGVVLRRRNGTEVPVGDSASPIRDRAGVVHGVVMIIRDESERRRLGAKLTFDATHDALTGLVNRREFERRLTRCIASLPGSLTTHIMLYLDLDRFKVINDTCGHEAGDSVLRSIGPLVAPHLRRGDTLARLGGDEFAILLDHCALDDADRIAEAIRSDLVRHPFVWAGAAFGIGVSIGLLPLTTAVGEIAAVIRAADAACYAAKADGGDRVHQSRWRNADVPFRMAQRVCRS